MQVALAQIVQATLVGVMRQAANLRDGRRDANRAPRPGLAVPRRGHVG